jgi:hypothetical protein
VKGEVEPQPDSGIRYFDPAGMKGHGSQTLTTDDPTRLLQPDLSIFSKKK